MQSGIAMNPEISIFVSSDYSFFSGKEGIIYLKSVEKSDQANLAASVLIHKQLETIHLEEENTWKRKTVMILH